LISGFKFRQELIEKPSDDLIKRLPDGHQAVKRHRTPYSREGLGTEVDFSLPAERVIRSLDRIME
jgi:putative transposase